MARLLHLIIQSLVVSKRQKIQQNTTSARKNDYKKAVTNNQENLICLSSTSKTSCSQKTNSCLDKYTSIEGNENSQIQQNQKSNFQSTVKGPASRKHKTLPAQSRPNLSIELQNEYHQVRFTDDPLENRFHEYLQINSPHTNNEQNKNVSVVKENRNGSVANYSTSPDEFSKKKKIKDNKSKRTMQFEKVLLKQVTHELKTLGNLDKTKLIKERVIMSNKGGQLVISRNRFLLQYKKELLGH